MEEEWFQWARSDSSVNWRIGVTGTFCEVSSGWHSASDSINLLREVVRLGSVSWRPKGKATGAKWIGWSNDVGPWGSVHASRQPLLGYDRGFSWSSGRGIRWQLTSTIWALQRWGELVWKCCTGRAHTRNLVGSAARIYSAATNIQALQPRLPKWEGNSTSGRT